jgi:hypothetical protein
MIDKDQHLLWEAYMAEKKADKDHDGDGEIESSEDEYQGSKDKAIKKAMNKEAHDPEHDEDEEVQEEMDNMQFSAMGRENPEQMVFNAVLSWMRADTEGLVTPEDYESYSMSDAFDDAKEFIRDSLQDISFSEIRAHLNDTVNLGDPEGAAFQQSVDDDIRRDDSRLQDAPPREPGV